MKRVIYLLIFTLLSSVIMACASYAQDDSNSPRRIFYKANSLYEKGAFDKAIGEYKKILDSGMESSNVYYNLGNCYFKKGDLGHAILNYERARRLKPGDQDVESNLEFARSLLRERPLAINMPLTARLADRLSEKFSVNIITVLASAIYIIVCIAIIMLIFFKGLGAFLKPLIFIFTALFMISAILAYGKISNLNKEAMVVTKEADARFEPSTKATAYFKLFQANTARILELRNGWYKIKRADGKTGWVEKAAMEIL